MQSVIGEMLNCFYWQITKSFIDVLITLVWCKHTLTVWNLKWWWKFVLLFCFRSEQNLTGSVSISLSLCQHLCGAVSLSSGWHHRFSCTLTFSSSVFHTLLAVNQKLRPSAAHHWMQTERTNTRMSLSHRRPTACVCFAEAWGLCLIDKRVSQCRKECSQMCWIKNIHFTYTSYNKQ